MSDQDAPGVCDNLTQEFIVARATVLASPAFLLSNSAAVCCNIMTGSWAVMQTQKPTVAS